MTTENNRILIAHSSLPEYEFDGDDLDRFYLPARGLAEAPSYAQKGINPIVIVPKHLEIQTLASFYRKTLLNGRSIEVIETPDTDYLMDRDIAQLPEVLDFLTSQISSGKRFEIYPYGVTDELLSWAQPLIDKGAFLVGDHKRYADRLWWGHKAGLHRWIDDLDNCSFAELAALPIAPGFVAQNIEEILISAKLLGSWEVILKPYILSGGFDMKRCSTKEDIESYVIPQMPIGMELSGNMPIVVEKLLNIDKDIEGQELIYSTQFVGQYQIGQITRQIVHNGLNWIGNSIPSGASQEFEAKAMQKVDDFLRYAKPMGPGGVDIASVDGQPVFLEINGGRPTGGHTPKKFKEAFSPQSPAVIFEKEDQIFLLGKDIEDVWDILNRTNYANKPLAFNREQGVGVYPMVWLKGMWSMLISFGGSLKESRALLEEAKSALYSS